MNGSLFLNEMNGRSVLKTLQCLQSMRATWAADTGVSNLHFFPMLVYWILLDLCCFSGYLWINILLCLRNKVFLVHVGIVSFSRDLTTTDILASFFPLFFRCSSTQPPISQNGITRTQKVSQKKTSEASTDSASPKLSAQAVYWNYMVERAGNAQKASATTQKNW